MAEQKIIIGNCKSYAKCSSSSVDIHGCSVPEKPTVNENVIEKDDKQCWRFGCHIALMMAAV